MYRLTLRKQMEQRMKKRLLGLLGFGTACAACCLPLVGAELAAFGFGSLLTAKIAGVSLDALLCVWGPVLFIGAAAIVLFTARRKRKVSLCECESSCRA